MGFPVRQTWLRCTVRALHRSGVMMTEQRKKLLRLALGKPHRYRRYRLATMCITFGILFAVPLLGIARVDLLGGDHYALGHPAPTVRAFVAVGAAIASFYLVTFLINLPAGRMFCGFGCPIGQLSRLADTADAFDRDPARRRRALLALGGFALLLSASVGLWWFAPAAYVAGPSAIIPWAATLLVAGYAVAHGWWFRWEFCRKLCPIGLYYSVVQANPLIGVRFDANRNCTDCDNCAAVCPVLLDPRHLDTPIPSPGGLAVEGFAGENHCLHCGACVEICEHMTRKLPGEPAMGFRRMAKPPTDPSA